MQERERSVCDEREREKHPTYDAAFKEIKKNMFQFLQFNVFDDLQLQNALVFAGLFFTRSVCIPCVSVLFTAIITVFFC